MISTIAMSSPSRQPRPILFLATALLLATDGSVSSPLFDKNTPLSNDYYCGLSWPHAAQHCAKPCPTGEDDECYGLGNNGKGNDDVPVEKYECFYFTGCAEKMDSQEDEEDDSSDGGNTKDSDGDDEEEEFMDASINNFCGKSWAHAMLGCSDACPNGFECSDGEECFAATNCHQPLETLVSELLTTLRGPDSFMDDTDQEIFGGTIGELISRIASEEGIALGEVNLGDQQIVGRRELQKRARHRALLGYDSYLNFELRNVTQRRLPTGSSAIDVSMVVTGDYRPPPYLDLDVIAEDSINRNGPKLVSTLRDRGEKAGREFFNRVEAIEAVKKVDVTKRPTRAPVKSPTWSPVGPPTSFPSGIPTYWPTSMPSGAPSRAHDQVIMTGGRNDLMLGGETTSSYGYIFNIRTKPDAGVILLNGFDFYTKSTEDVTFEVWTRLGSFKGYKGTYDGWDLIASGTTKGRGIGRYTSIPEEMFTPIAIPGGGGETGTRAFYMTLDTIDLVYKLGERGGMSDEKTHAETDDIEIWEGEGVLFYPFPDPKDKFFYRMPRQYLGAIYYDRLPCKPFSIFGPIQDMPCPEVPTTSPTLPPPTKSPVPPPTISPSSSPVKPTPPPTDDPTVAPPEPTPSPILGQTPAPINPTEMPTFSPTISLAPSSSPTSSEPTMSPVVPMRSYVVATLINVPKRSMTQREMGNFVEILTLFLQRHTERSMVLEAIELWHQEVIVVDAIQSPVVARSINNKHQHRRFLEWKRKKPDPIPQVNAVDITLILKISVATLPLELLGNLALVAIEEHEQELLALLHEQQSFYTFFKDTDGVFCRTIDEVTYAPTGSPTTEEYFLAQQTLLEADANKVEILEENARSGFAIFVGLGIGLLWCLLTAISVGYLLSARGKMEEQHDMENLLNAEKAPINGAGNAVVDVSDGGAGTTKDAAGNVVVDLNNTSSRSIGNTEKPSPLDIDDLDLWDHSENSRLSTRARNELSKSSTSNKSSTSTRSKGGNEGIRRVASGASLNNVKENEEDIETGKTMSNSSQYMHRRKPNSRRDNLFEAPSRSTIVTSREKKAILESDAKKRRVVERDLLMRRSAGAKLMVKDAQMKLPDKPRRKRRSRQTKSIHSMIVTLQEKKAVLESDDKKHVALGRDSLMRRSAGAKLMAKESKVKLRNRENDTSKLEPPSSELTTTPSRGITKRLSQSMVLPKTDSIVSEIDSETALKSERRVKGRQHAKSKSMVIRNSRNARAA